jgi:hypothetical protein
MNIFAIIAMILFILVCVFGYIIFNLMRKQEVAEDLVIGYNEYLDKLSRVIELSDIKIKQIDAQGTFKSDDEIGFFFEQIKKIQDILNEFNLKKLNG